MFQYLGGNFYEHDVITGETNNAQNYKNKIKAILNCNFPFAVYVAGLQSEAVDMQPHINTQSWINEFAAMSLA